MKRFVFLLVMLLVPLGFAELFAYYLTQSHTSLFAPDDQAVDAMIDETTYQDFLAELYHPQLGWQNPRARTLTEVNCIGEEKSYQWDDHGARHLDSSREVQVIVVGDSYTHGHEASDSETYPFRLGVHSGLNVANYGVNGFGPLQAILQFERAFERHQTAEIAILGIMSENIRRVPNGYRGLFHFKNAHYQFKPFVDIAHGEPRAMPNPNASAAPSIEELRARIKAAFKADYWHLPQPSFPYLWSTVQALQTKVLKFFVRSKLIGPGKSVDFADEALVGGLRYVAWRFIESAEAKGVLPIIAFLPENRLHLDAPKALVAELRAASPESVIVDLGEAAIDWSQYNLNGTVCHPSPYGYDQIARVLAATITSRQVEERLSQLDRDVR